jgi:hypothetical protein
MTTWTPEARPFASWDVAGFDRQRITEDGKRRVIEQGSQVVRIIERFRATWGLDPPASGNWTNEA